jgi:hypothetical protein
MTDDGDVLPRIGAPATRALAAAGVTRLSELTEYRADELLALHGVGQRAIELLRVALRERGLAFVDERT